MLTLGAAAFAQTAPAIGRLYTYEAARGAMADMNDLQRDTVAIYKANKSPITRHVWTSLAGKPTLKMFIPIPSLAELNEPTWLSRQGTEIERTGRQMRLARAMESSEMQVLFSVPELAWDETPNAPPDAFAVVNTVRVKPGHVAAFMESRKEVDAALRKTGKVKSISAQRIRYGGNSYDFHIVVGYESLADISTSGAQELRKQMGDAKYAAYLKGNSENIESLETNLFRYRPEFSYVPER